MLKSPEDVAFLLAAFGLRVSHLKIGLGTPNFPRHLIAAEFDEKNLCQKNELFIIMIDIT